MARRRKSLIDEAAESPGSAVALAIFGLILWGPIPEFIIRAMFGGEKPITDGSTESMSNMMSNGFMGMFLMNMPWMEVIGIAMVAISFLFLAIHAHRNRISHPKIKKQHITGAFAAVFIGLCYLTTQSWNIAIDPAQARERMDELQSTMTPGNMEPPIVAEELPSEFPESGTTIWGSQGQPISGNLSTMSIWDVSGSDQNKVIRIRRHVPTYNRGANTSEPVATIFLAAGERKDLQLKPGLYDVVVGSSEGWNEQGFTGAISIASFGTINAAAPGAPAILAIGAPDQEASLVDESWF